MDERRFEQRLEEPWGAYLVRVTSRGETEEEQAINAVRVRNSLVENVRSWTPDGAANPRLSQADWLACAAALAALPSEDEVEDAAKADLIRRLGVLANVAVVPGG